MQLKSPKFSTHSHKSQTYVLKPKTLPLYTGFGIFLKRPKNGRSQAKDPGRGGSGPGGQRDEEGGGEREGINFPRAFPFRIST